MILNISDLFDFSNHRENVMAPKYFFGHFNHFLLVIISLLLIFCNGKGSTGIKKPAQTLFAKIEGDSMTFHQFEEVLYAMYESSSMTDYSDMKSY